VQSVSEQSRSPATVQSVLTSPIPEIRRQFKKHNHKRNMVQQLSQCQMRVMKIVASCVFIPKESGI
jgi:hypothetical protein